MYKACTLFLFLFCNIRSYCQFAPQAPLPGHEGIYLTDERIIEWASGATFERGLLDIADEASGYPTYGSSSSPLGYPDGDILSLGDRGQATVTFDHSIKNGAGPDFAIFENGFADPLDSAMAYLEFAFVEVSSDGARFVRFPATCNIQDTAQTDNFTYSDASKVYNLAGKYKVQYGTPFDLEELKDSTGIDVNNITHIRLIDVVGSIAPAYASYDNDGHIINDPYPSVYPSGGFDLDAVGVLNSNKPLALNNFADKIKLNVYPNPVDDILHISVQSDQKLNFILTNIAGSKVRSGVFTGSVPLSLKDLNPGIYLLHLYGKEGAVTLKVNKYS